MSRSCSRVALLAVPALVVLLLLPESVSSESSELDGRRLAVRGWWKRRAKWRARHDEWLEAQAGIEDSLDTALAPVNYALPTDLTSASSAGGAASSLAPLASAEDAVPLIEFCRDGKLNREGDICCPSACDSCGGLGCSEKIGGSANCCTDKIHATGKVCGTDSDLKCVMPKTCLEDKCLLECPFHSGCASIWKRRGWTVREMHEFDDLGDVATGDVGQPVAETAEPKAEPPKAEPPKAEPTFQPKTEPAPPKGKAGDEPTEEPDDLAQGYGPCDFAEQIKINLATAALSHNNLGGLGPDPTAPLNMRYFQAGTWNGKPFDVVIDNVTEYSAENGAKNNGRSGLFARINVDYGSQSKFRFRVVDSQTGEPVVLPSAHLKIYNLDTQYGEKWSHCNEMIGMDSADQDFEATWGEDIKKAHSGPKTWFLSTGPGNVRDVPESPDGLTEEQAARSVEIHFGSLSKFELVVAYASATFDPTTPLKLTKVDGGNCRNPGYGRNLLFTFLGPRQCSPSPPKTEIKAQPPAKTAPAPAAAAAAPEPAAAQAAADKAKEAEKAKAEAAAKSAKAKEEAFAKRAQKEAEEDKSREDKAAQDAAANEEAAVARAKATDEAELKVEAASPRDTLPTKELEGHAEACNFAGEIAVDLGAATLSHNNLGGVGPDPSAPPNMRYFQAGTWNGKPFDVVVDNVTEYMGPTAPRTMAKVACSPG